MADDRIPTRNVRITLFAKEELDRLVEAISTQYPSLKVKDGALLGALVLAAHHIPHEAVAAILGTYWDRDREVRSLGPLSADSV